MMSDLASVFSMLNEYLQTLLETELDSEKTRWIVRSEILLDEPDLISFCTRSTRSERLARHCYEKLCSNAEEIKKILKTSMEVESVVVGKFNINLLAKAETLPSTGEIFTRRCTSATMFKISAKFGKADEPPRTPPPKKGTGSSNRKAKKDSLAPLPRSFAF